MPQPTLFIFSGLPAAGKTTLARALATSLAITYLRIDTIEQALRDLCHVQVEGEGYRLTYRIAADVLQLGLSVVADSCNPIGLTRREWEAVATENSASFVNIEVVCSDQGEHRQRVGSRRTDIETLQLPTWQDVLSRNYEPWSGDRLIVDTAGKTIEDSVTALLRQL
ncbi:MAG: AAA family ATPase [Cyanophyceae cyanobacterium]